MAENDDDRLERPDGCDWCGVEDSDEYKPKLNRCPATGPDGVHWLCDFCYEATMGSAILDPVIMHINRVAHVLLQKLGPN